MVNWWHIVSWNSIMRLKESLFFGLINENKKNMEEQSFRGVQDDIGRQREQLVRSVRVFIKKSAMNVASTQLKTGPFSIVPT